MQNAYAAYREASITADDPRAIEYKLMAKAATALELSAEDPIQLPAAIFDNRRLWQTLVTDLSDPGNKLPDRMKADLIGLGLFVERHSEKVLRREADVAVLIDINRTVMKGLVGKPSKPQG